MGRWRYCLDIPNHLTMLEGNVTGVSGTAFQVALTCPHYCGAGTFRDCRYSLRRSNREKTSYGIGTTCPEQPQAGQPQQRRLLGTQLPLLAHWRGWGKAPGARGEKGV
jgi:hypothetical protein